MDWVRRVFGGWRARGQGRVRRVIVVGIDGLEPALIDEYLEQGLLHNLALLGDIGTYARLGGAPPSFAPAPPFLDAVRAAGVRTTVLVPPSIAAATDTTGDAFLKSVCAADREQQEALFAALRRVRRGLIVTAFVMPAQLERRLESIEDERRCEDWRLVIRDTYARMDEVVGKALSFVDEQTALLVVPAAADGLLFSNVKLSASNAQWTDIGPTVLELLGVAKPASTAGKSLCTSGFPA